METKESDTTTAQVFCRRCLTNGDLKRNHFRLQDWNLVVHNNTPYYLERVSPVEKLKSPIVKIRLSIFFQNKILSHIWRLELWRSKIDQVPKNSNFDVNHCGIWYNFIRTSYLKGALFFHHGHVNGCHLNHCQFHYAWQLFRTLNLSVDNKFIR